MRLIHSYSFIILFFCLFFPYTTCIAEDSVIAVEETKTGDEDKFSIPFPSTGGDDDEPVSGGPIVVGGDDDESGPIPVPVDGDEDSHEIECSLFNMLECGLGNFCKGNAFGSCNGTAGICTGVPLFCSATYAPVCGCNGKTYSNECRAHAEMQNIAYVGECEGERVTNIETEPTKVDISLEEKAPGKPDREQIREMKRRMKEAFDRKRGRKVKR